MCSFFLFANVLEDMSNSTTNLVFTLLPCVVLSFRYLEEKVLCFLD